MCDKIKDEEHIKKYRLADFFNAHWDSYSQNPKHFITAEQYKAVNAIRTCRTEALGIDHFACSECGEITKVYHSCKNRFCPTCSWSDTLKWAEKIKQNMMDVPHRHVVITLPHQLNTLIKTNGKYLLNSLLQAAADTFKDWMLAKHQIKTGVISVLHTFGETKNYHPHVHMIVAWGGVHIKTGKLISLKKDFINHQFLQQKFRAKFEDKLFDLYYDKTLKHKYANEVEFKTFVKQINNKQWVLHLEPSMDIPEKVVRYIGRYSKRACISEYKITNIKGEFISFKYKDYRDTDENGKPKEKILELHYNDFFPKLLQHVPLPYFRLVRYYGLYANKSQLSEEYKAKEQETIEIAEIKEIKEVNNLFCKHCNCLKQYQFTSFKNRKNNSRKEYKRDLYQQHRKIPDKQTA